jgi:hypothetical protein
MKIEELKGRAGLGFGDLAALAQMLDSGSTMEAMCDEFGVNQRELKVLNQHMADAARSVGGMGALSIMLLRAEDEETPVVEKPKVNLPAPKALASKRPRTSAGLRDALFDAMNDLRAGKMDASTAKAFGNLAAVICKTVELEMSAEKLRKSGAIENPGRPTILRLGGDED